MAVEGEVDVAWVAWRRIRGRVGIHWRFCLGGKMRELAKRARVALNIV